MLLYITILGLNIEDYEKSDASGSAAFSLVPRHIAIGAMLARMLRQVDSLEMMADSHDILCDYK